MAALAVCAAVALAGCELNDDGTNLVNGKTLFMGEGQCAACHTLARAGARGVAGPNLDEAFQQALKDGFRRSTFEGMVYAQILHPNNDQQVDPKTGEPNTQTMPANLVTGEDAEDVAAYVAQAVAAPGEDPGRLADVGAQQSDEVAQAEGGTLDIPAADSGLAYAFGSAEAPAGALTIESPNPQSLPHNIALEGDGVDEEGEVVQNGGTSVIEVDVQPGEYTFYCSVPGHREGGMEGTLKVE